MYLKKMKLCKVWNNTIFVTLHLRIKELKINFMIFATKKQFYGCSLYIFIF